MAQGGPVVPGRRRWGCPAVVLPRTLQREALRTLHRGPCTPYRAPPSGGLQRSIRYAPGAIRYNTAVSLLYPVTRVPYSELPAYPIPRGAG